MPTEKTTADRWGLPDPKGQHIDEVRAIRDVIGKKVEDLLHELTPARLRSRRPHSLGTRPEGTLHSY